MPRSKRPSKFMPEFIKELKIPEDQYFTEILKYFPPENRAAALDLLKEVFISEKKSRELLFRQTNKTTPASMIVLLKSLSETLQPFLDPKLAVESETFDFLNPTAQKLHELIAQRTKELKVIKLNGGLEADYTRFFVGYLNRIFSEYCSDSTIVKDRRRFIALCLDLAELSYPDPEDSMSKFDKQFIVPYR